MARPGKLTQKQAKFIKEYTSNGGNGTQAVLKTYDVENPRTATVMAVENLSKPSIRDVIEAAMVKQGLTPDKIAENIKGLATREADKVPADVILRSNVELLKLWGAYPGSKHTNLNLNIKGKMQGLSFQDAKRELERLNAQLGEVVEEPGIEDVTGS